MCLARWWSRYGLGKPNLNLEYIESWNHEVLILTSDHQDCIPKSHGIFEIKKQQSTWPNKQPI